MGPRQNSISCPCFPPAKMPNLDIDTAITCMSHTQDPALNIILDSLDSDYRHFVKDIKNKTNLSSYQKLLHSDRDISALIITFGILFFLLLESKVLRLLHFSQAGLNKTLLLAKDLYFWLVTGCSECSKLLPSQMANPSVTQSWSCHLGTPMQHVGLDLFSHLGSTFLVCVYNWSRYLVYEKLSSVSTASVVKCLKSWFNLLG